MVAAILFTRPDPHTGPAATNLFRITGGAGLVVTIDGTEWRYPNATTASMRFVADANAEAVLLREDGKPLSLASVPDAVAAAIVNNGDGWIFWFDGGQCTRVDRCSSMAGARSEVEGRAGWYKLF